VGFFARDDDGSAPTEDLRRIEAGGIPTAAEDRLRALAVDGSMFTSGLSVNEFALLGRLGPQPLAQVMGASVIRTGWQYLPPLPPGLNVISGSWFTPTNVGYAAQSPYTEASPSQVRNYKWHSAVVSELDVLTDAWNLARRRALDRLTEEARQVGADAVVGVHLRRSDHDLGKRTIDYAVTGTAVRVPDAGPTEQPTLTDVSVQDYWRLNQAGQEPTALVATTAVVFASAPVATRMRRARTTARNQELEELSEGFQLAREAVRERLRGQVYDAHGGGAVGVELSHSVRREKLPVGSSLQSTDVRGWQRSRLGIPVFVSGHIDADRRGWVITMHAAGTAVRRRAGTAAPTVKPAMRMGSR
jgi:hypothetical protein